MTNWRNDVAHTAASLVNRRNGGMLLAASAVAAAAWQEIEHRRVLRADLPAAHIRVERLADLRSDKQALAAVQEGLLREWGDFALLGFDDVHQMAREAGQTIFIASEVDEQGHKTPKGALQTVLAQTNGDPGRLVEQYANFNELTSRRAWRESGHHGGDTAVLLQITVFDKDGRGGGLGSLLRDAVLHMLPSDVSFALTATPADAATVDLEDKSTFNAAMRFHARGGAAPTVLLPHYKASREDEDAHGNDVAIMRYARNEDGQWSVARPEMRTRAMGPMQRRMATAASRLKVLGGRGSRTLRSRLRHRGEQPVLGRQQVSL